MRDDFMQDFQRTRRRMRMFSTAFFVVIITMMIGIVGVYVWIGCKVATNGPEIVGTVAGRVMHAYHQEQAK